MPATGLQGRGNQEEKKEGKVRKLEKQTSRRNATGITRKQKWACSGKEKKYGML
jgi:hypothetical protein